MTIQAMICKPTLARRQVVREMLMELHPEIPEAEEVQPRLGTQMEQLFQELRLEE